MSGTDRANVRVESRDPKGGHRAVYVCTSGCTESAVSAGCKVHGLFLPPRETSREWKVDCGRRKGRGPIG